MPPPIPRPLPTVFIPSCEFIPIAHPRNPAFHGGPGGEGEVCNALTVFLLGFWVGGREDGGAGGEVGEEEGFAVHVGLFGAGEG